jgi:SPP1 gp7 family putative phage head morphogenesis protein
LYSCTCNECQHEAERLNLAINPRFKTLLKTIEKAYKKLHKKGSYKVEDLETVKEYKAIVTDTTNLLERALEDNDLSDDMLKSLKEDIFYFSGYKTHAQLLEASRELLTEDNKLKSFTAFNNDVSKIKTGYNENYLEAEYDFAVGSVQMAERYNNFKDSDRYLLQYRTANDERVRESHQALHNISLPKTDAFWDKYFPPNGWRCRCTTVQVLASSNEKSDSKAAAKKADKATTKIDKNGKNSLEIFRFNAGKEKVVFPPKHPYKKVVGATKIKTILKRV